MIFMLKLNDTKNGLSSINNDYQNNAIYIHNIAQKNNIHITDFDYIPNFGILNSDWIDDLHWTNNFFLKWTNWIVHKIFILLKLYNINFKKKKILLISDSSLDYDNNKKNNRIQIFKKILDKYSILYKIIAKSGGAFSSKYKSNNFYNMINKNKIKKNKYCAIIVIGGINDCFCKKKNKIKSGIKNFVKISKKILYHTN